MPSLTLWASLAGMEHLHSERDKRGVFAKVAATTVKFFKGDSDGGFARAEKDCKCETCGVAFLTPHGLQTHLNCDGAHKVRRGKRLAEDAPTKPLRTPRDAGFAAGGANGRFDPCAQVNHNTLHPTPYTLHPKP